MAAAGVISDQAFAEAAAEPVPQLRTRDAVSRAASGAGAARRRARTRRCCATTIDPRLQREVEALLRREAASLDPQATFAALVVDNRERQVIAYVGNADFLSGARHGTIDMARAIRSPGSALKPFIYAMAFDRLIIHPETLLDDRPSHFGDYAPGDFDGQFLGEVSARQALQYSLNVPAVAVLDRLGPARFTAALAAAGIRLKLPQPSSEPGLAVALGGDGISLFDLATLYVALSHDGAVAPLRTRLDEPDGRETTIFGPVAAWYVNDILTSAPPPPGMLPVEVRLARKLAFKTGTSYGFRDAWAVGYDRDVTIAVWAGRPDGTPMPGITGRTTAAPVAVQDRRSAGAAGRRATGRSRRRPARCSSPGATCRRVAAPRSRARPSAPAAMRAGRRSSIRRTARRSNGMARRCRSKHPAAAAPLRWLADGKPLPPGEPRRAFFWDPDGVGFTRLTVIDAAGRSAHATVRLEP